MTAYNPKEHARALKALEAAEAKAQRLIAQADAVRKDSKKYEILASGLVDARREKVIHALGRAAYKEIMQTETKSINLSDWLEKHEFMLTEEEARLCREDLDHVKGSSSIFRVKIARLDAQGRQVWIDPNDESRMRATHAVGEK